jgi:glycosyltransferase involved in cell wall biosynthesis
MCKISVVIRCYNEEEHIGRLLGGLMEQTVIDETEIIVVDSGSTDATVKIASQFPTNIVSIHPDEFSFGYALNVGCNEADGDVLVFASAHVYPVYEDWLERMAAPFEDPKVALVYGKQRGNHVTRYSEHQLFQQWFPDASDWDQDHPFCNNANAAIRRSIWKEVPYDGELTGLEDLDWAKRVQDRGYKIVYDADAEIVHVHDESPMDIMNRYRREAIALKHIFPQQQFSFYDFLRLFVGNVLSDYHHAWHDGKLLQNLADIPLFRLMQFWGTYHGYKHQGDVDRRLRRRFYYPNRIDAPNDEPIQTENDGRTDQKIRYDQLPSRSADLQSRSPRRQVVE